MKLSVFIPSVPWHYNCIEDILKTYLRSPVRPDEIVVLCSGYKVPDKNIQRIGKLYSSRGVRIITIGDIIQAGPARQVALKACSGDIIMYQDSDDLPHNYRVKLIKEYFSKNKNVMVVHHSYDHKVWGKAKREPRKVVTGDKIYEAIFTTGRLVDCVVRGAFGDVCGFPVHAGVPCLRREVLNEIVWKAAEDLVLAPEPKTKTEDFEFSHECLYHYKDGHHILNDRIYLYR